MEKSRIRDLESGINIPVPQHWLRIRMRILGSVPPLNNEYLAAEQEQDLLPLFQAVIFTYDVRCLKPGPRSVPRLRSGSSPPVILWLCARTERPLPPGQQRPSHVCYREPVDSFADPRWFLSRILIFYPCRIPDPTTATKEREKICCLTFFAAANYSK